MQRKLTRNETHRNRKYKLFFVLSVVVWALFVIWIVTVPAKSDGAPQRQETSIVLVSNAQEQEEGRLPGDDIPATEYASLDAMESLGEYKVTAYCGCVECCGVWSAEHPSRGSDYVQKTASGTIPQAEKTVAADWSVLPKGSEIVLNGTTYTVEDSGVAVKGKHIDLYMDDHAEALQWGVQYIEVYREAK